MKQFIITLLAGYSFTSCAFAQEHAHWKFFARKIDSVQCEIHLCATIDKGWYIFSQFSDGPGSTTIKFESNHSVKFEGGAKEKGDIVKNHDPLFNTDVIRITGSVEFIQRVLVRKQKLQPVRGEVRTFACNGKTCLPPQNTPFSIALN